MAVLGASRHPGKRGHRLVQNLVATGFEGDVFPVTPGAAAILGRDTGPCRGPRAPRGLRRAVSPRAGGRHDGGGPVGGPGDRLPFSRQRAEILRGFRGAAVVDEGALAAVLVAIGDLLVAHPAIAELDLTPLIASGGSRPWTR